MKSGHHAKQDLQSLLLHAEAVKLLEADPALADQALATLERWDKHVSSHSKPLRDRWVQIIISKDWALALEQSEQGKQLRQASPLATLLPQAVRMEILRSMRSEDNE